MNDAESAIVDLLRDGPGPMRPLTRRLPKATVFEALRRLRDRGVVVPGDRGGHWRLREDSPAAPLAGPSPTPAGPASWPCLPYAQLTHMPSLHHRAVAELALLSRLVRLVWERHHESHVLYSTQGLKGKTWLMTAIAIMLDADPDRVIVHAGAETRGSLGVRRRSTGEVAQIRAALAGPLLGIDEKRRGRADVQKVVDLLINGNRTIPLEDGVLEVLAVVMISLNSPADAGDVAQATGLDQPMQRRCSLSNLDGVVLDETFAKDGEERLERLRALGPVPLPEPGSREIESTLGDEISRMLPLVVDGPERLGSLDVVLLRQEAVAATWCGLSPADAVALVMHRHSVVWSSTRWTRPDWEPELAKTLGRTGAALATRSPAVEASELPADEPVDLELDYGTRIARLDEVARAHGVGDPDCLDKALRLGASVLRAGFGEGDLAGLRVLIETVRGPEGNAGERLGVLAVMDEVGILPEEVERMLRTAAAGGPALGLGGEDLVAVARELSRLGLDPAWIASWIRGAIEQHGTLDQELEARKAEVKDWENRRTELAKDVAWLVARREKFLSLLDRAYREPALRAALRVSDDELDTETVLKIVDEVESVATPREGEATRDAGVCCSGRGGDGRLVNSPDLWVLRLGLAEHAKPV